MTTPGDILVPLSAPDLRDDGAVLFDVSLDPTRASPERLVEAAVVAEASGFDGIWCYDHISGSSLGGTTSADPWTLLGAVAVATERISLGTLVVNLSIRHPAHVAVAAATLQSLAGGRVLLGVGAGAGPGSPFATELGMVGLSARPDSERRRMVEEGISVIRALWSGGRSVSGNHFSVAGATGFPVPLPSPPIIVGANGPKMSRLAGRSADGVNLHSSEPDLERLIGIVRATASERTPIITVEAPMEPEFVDRAERRRMGRLGVDRLVLAWGGDDTTEIERIGAIVSGR